MIRVGEPNDYAAEILIYLPKAASPLEPKTGHVFTVGEVRIKVGQAGAWEDVPITPVVGNAQGRIVERGGGWYAIRTTAAQRAVPTTIAYEAVCAGAQPDRGTEVVGNLSGDIAEGAAGLVPFFLPNALDPIEGDPVEGHVFTLGEVELSLPDDAFADVDLSAIVEFGGGLYGVLTDSTQSTKRGKAIVVANVPGAQRYSGYRTILGEGALVAPIPPSVPELLPAGESASDSTIGGDLRLTWSNTTGTADLSLVSSDASGRAADLATDRGLVTAMLLSLFLDRRAEPDDVPPSGDPNDRRGWWADEFSDVEGDRIGSRLWLLDRSKLTNETVLRAKEYVLEAWAWLLEDRVVESIDVTVEREAAGIAIGGTVQRPGRDPVAFSHVWDHLQESV